MYRRLLVMWLMGFAMLLGSLSYAAGQSDTRTGALQITPPEDRGYLRVPLRIMNRSTYDAYQLDASKEGSAIISYTVSRTGWVRVRLVRRDNKDIVLRTIQQWTQSHYDNKRKYEIEWDGKDASGNRIDPKKMFILFEGRDATHGGPHAAHAEANCKDPELTAATLRKAGAVSGEVMLEARLNGPPSTSSDTRGYEGRVYLDDKLINTVRFPVGTRTFSFGIKPSNLTQAGRTLTINVDDHQDHIGAASIHLRTPGHKALSLR